MAFAASTEESRPILNGVLWELRPERMRMVATNGHRLARMDVAGYRRHVEAGQADLDHSARRRWTRSAGCSADKDELEIAKSENHLGFRSASTQVFTRLIEGPYPNYEQVIPQENDKSATADKVCPHLSHSAHEHRRQRPDPSDSAGARPMGRASSRFRLPTWARPRRKWHITYDGDSLEIGFNATYLLEILKFMPDRRGADDLQGARTRCHLRAGGLERSRDRTSRS